MSSAPPTQLWLLRPRGDVLARESHPWRPWFDKVFGLVVRAPSEQVARALAQSQAGNEGLALYRNHGYDDEASGADLWLDPAYTTCEPLASEGNATVILVDRRRA